MYKYVCNKKHYRVEVVWNEASFGRTEDGNFSLHFLIRKKDKLNLSWENPIYFFIKRIKNLYIRTVVSHIYTAQVLPPSQWLSIATRFKCIPTHPKPRAGQRLCGTSHSGFNSSEEETVPEKPQLKAANVIFCTLNKYLLESISSHSRAGSWPTVTLNRRYFFNES